VQSGVLKSGDKLPTESEIMQAYGVSRTVVREALKLLAARGLVDRPLNIIINCRPDRIERNGQMGALVPELEPDRVVLIGEPTRSARSAIPAHWQGPVTDLGGRRRPEELLDGILADVDQEASIVLVGNIHGQGEVLLEQLQTLAGNKEPRRATP